MLHHRVVRNYIVIQRFLKQVYIKSCDIIIVNAISPTACKRPDKLKLSNSAEEDSKVETGPENGLFWLRRLDRYSTISTILNFQCETAREVPLQGMGSILYLDTFSWKEHG